MKIFLRKSMQIFLIFLEETILIQNIRKIFSSKNIQKIFGRKSSRDLILRKISKKDLVPGGFRIDQNLDKNTHRFIIAYPIGYVM